jgi:sarcosine oxidase subunit beta
MKKADVVVIGGGTIGASVAYYLARSGKTVSLIEKDDIASGECTRGGGGFLSLQSKLPGFNQKLGSESIKAYDRLAAELGCDIEYQKRGVLTVIETDEQLDFYGKFVGEQQKAGIDVTLLDSDETRRVEPALSGPLAGAAYSPNERSLHIHYLAFGLAEAAKRYGAKIYTKTEVRQIRTKNGQITSVITNDGEIETNIVVNAAGISAPTIGKMVGLDIPIIPAKGQDTVTEAVPPFIESLIMSVDYMELKHKGALKEIPAAVGGEQTKNGNLILGGTYETGVSDTSTTIMAIKAILRNWVRLAPAVRHIHVIRTFAGVRPGSPDGLPILGKTEVDGFMVAAGHGGDGTTLAPITGKLITELVNEGKTSIDIEKLSLSRF